MNDHIEAEAPTRENASNSTTNHGFTLVELLIVIVILGMLAAVTVFAVRGISEDETSACSTEKRTITTALESYHSSPAAAGAYPTTLAALAPDYLASPPDSAHWRYAPSGTGNTTYFLEGAGKCA